MNNNQAGGDFKEQQRLASFLLRQHGLCFTQKWAQVVSLSDAKAVLALRVKDIDDVNKMASGIFLLTLKNDGATHNGHKIANWSAFIKLNDYVRVDCVMANNGGNIEWNVSRVVDIKTPNPIVGKLLAFTPKPDTCGTQCKCSSSTGLVEMAKRNDGAFELWVTSHKALMLRQFKQLMELDVDSMAEFERFETITFDHMSNYVKLYWATFN